MNPNEESLIESESDLTTKLESSHKFEKRENVEFGPEDTDANRTLATELLQNPPENNFVIGLKKFEDWVKNLLLGKK